ncbi:MAG: EpsG family protein [Clostridia bacterium]|nr:EpsG family protein [Clostridia bacterium]
MELDNALLFLWIGVMAIILYFTDYTRTETLGDKQVRRYKPLLAVILFVPIILFAVVGRVRSDTYSYLAAYRSIPTTFREAWTYLLDAEEKGWALFNVSVHTVSFGNETMYRLAIALVHSIPLIVIFRKYSPSYLLTLYLFIAGGYHLGWMTNGLRQFMAVSIIVAATPWMVDKKYIRSILIILLAATFHRTALYMIPVMFIAQGRIWDYRTLLLILAVTALTFIVTTNTKLFDDFAELVGYSTEAAREWGDDGANPIRVLVSAVPMALSFLFRWQIRAERDLAINFFVNLSVVTVAMSVFAMITSGIMTGRMIVYTGVYNLILLPYLLKSFREIRTRRIVNLACVGLYFIYFLYESGTL